MALLIRKKADEDHCADLLAHGAQPLRTRAEVAPTVDVIIICVTGSTQGQEVLVGDNGILQTLTPGCAVVDCSTTLPDCPRPVAQAVAAKGGRFLGAAMTSTPKHADEGALTLLVCGETQAASFIGDPVHNVYTMAGNLRYKTAFARHLLSSFNRLSGAR